MLGTFRRVYGTTEPIAFALASYDGQTLQMAATFAAGDLKLSKDGAAEANATNLPVDTGSGYTWTPTAAELTCKRLVGYLVDQAGGNAWLPDHFVIETTDHPSSQHPDPWLLDMGTAQAASAGGLTLRAGAPATPRGSILIVTSATTGVNQVGVIASRAGDVVTLEQTWADGGGVQPTGTITYRVYAGAPAPAAIAADMVRVNGNATAAQKIEASAEGIIPFAIGTGTSTTTSLRTDLPGTAAEQYDDRMIVFRSTTPTVALRGVSKPVDSFTPGSPGILVLGYRDAGGNLVLTPLPVAPSAGDVAVLI
jgi:hypothetical protein